MRLISENGIFPVEAKSKRLPPRSLGPPPVNKTKVCDGWGGGLSPENFQIFGRKYPFFKKMASVRS